MRNKNKFHNLQAKNINELISIFTSDKIEYVKIENRFFLKNEMIVSKKPYASGLFLGEQKDDIFIPSPALIDVISKKSNKKIYVNDKAEWLFLCGRDVLKKSVVKGELKDGEFVLVQNKNDENLGYGKVVGDNVKNILDKGEYLRMER